MALTKADREWLQLKMGETVNTAVDPIRTLVEKHHHSLYGPNHDNGLTSDVRALKTAIRKLNWLYASVTGAVGALSFFRSKIFGE